MCPAPPSLGRTAARKRVPTEPGLRRLYFSVDRVDRSYWFGINHTNRKVWPDRFWEHDAVDVHGFMRHPYDKPIETIQLHIEPLRIERERFNPEASCIGVAWMEQKTVLYARIELPADAFYSVVEGLGRGAFKEASITLLNFKRGKAHVDGICLEAQLTAEDDLCVI